MTKFGEPIDFGVDDLLTDEDRIKISEFNKLIDNYEGWHLKHESQKSDYKAYNKTTDSSPLVIARGEITVNKTPEEVFGWMAGDTSLWPSKMRKQDSMAINPEVLEQTDAKHTVHYCDFKLPMPLTNRDTLWNLLCTKVSEDEFMIIGENATHESKPVEKDSLMMSLVRSEIGVSGYRCKRTADNKCFLTYVVQADPKGWIPTIAVNQIALDQAQNVKRVKAEMEGKATED